MPSGAFDHGAAEHLLRERGGRRSILKAAPSFGGLSPKDDQSSVAMPCSIGVGRSQLARRFSSPPLECVSECAHLVKAEQPRDLRYMHLAVVEVTNRQIAPEVLEYLAVVQPFIRELSCKCPLAHSQTASHVFHEHPSMRKHR